MPRAYSLGILAGIGAGFASASGLMLLLYARGYQWGAGEGLLTWLGLFTTALGLVFLFSPWLFAEQEPVSYETPETTAAPAQPVAQYERLFNSAHGSGVERRYKPITAIEAAWIDASADFLLWARQLGTLAGPAHVGVSCQNPNDWQLIIAPLVDFGGIAPTQKGVTTHYTPDYDATRLYNAVLAGYVTFGEAAPPKITPYSARRMTVEANAAGISEGA